MSNDKAGNNKGKQLNPKQDPPKQMKKGQKSTVGSSLYLHAFYITVVAVLLYLIKAEKSQHSAITNQLKESHATILELNTKYSDALRPRLDASSFDYAFRKSSETNDASYFDIPPDIFPNPFMRVWKWNSNLTSSQCNSIWQSAEAVDDYGEYSKFGSEFPTFDVSLDKLNSKLHPMFEKLISDLGRFIVARFITKLEIDGNEMRFSNGTAYYEKDIDYMRFLQLKGTPFVIKYDAALGKASKLRYLYNKR